VCAVASVGTRSVNWLLAVTLFSLSLQSPKVFSLSHARTVGPYELRPVTDKSLESILKKPTKVPFLS